VHTRTHTLTHTCSHTPFGCSSPIALYLMVAPTPLANSTSTYACVCMY
jgi:hypothetical protein